jgi:hypothetical protein
VQLLGSDSMPLGFPPIESVASMHFGRVAEPRMRNFKHLLGILIYFPCFDLTDILNSKNSIFHAKKNRLIVAAENQFSLPFPLSFSLIFPFSRQIAGGYKKIIIKFKRRGKSDVR